MAADVDGARRLALDLDQPDLLGTTLLIQGEIAAHAAGSGSRRSRGVVDGARSAARRARRRCLLDAVRAPRDVVPAPGADADYRAGVAFCDDRELAVYGSCLRGRHALSLVEQGRWDEALAVADEVLTSTASPVNLLTSRVATALVRMRT